MRTLIDSAQAACWAIHQCTFGAESSKPTRLASNSPDTLPFGCNMPTFDGAGLYTGPLSTCMHGWRPPLIGAQDGQSITTAAAAYPPDMCAYLALLFTSALSQRSDPKCWLRAQRQCPPLTSAMLRNKQLRRGLLTELNVISLTFQTVNLVTKKRKRRKNFAKRTVRAWDPRSSVPSRTRSGS